MAVSVARIVARPWVSRSTWSVGIDIGQASDPTAFCAVEAVRWHKTAEFAKLNLPSEVDEEKPKDELRIRALQRLPLGLGYIEQCQIIADLLSEPSLASAGVFLEAPGVGKPNSDLFLRAGVRHTPIWITGGRDEQSHGAGFTVPKLILVSRLQAALHSSELRIAKALPEAAAFTRELQEFRASWTEAGHLRFGARQGAHDDLVLAAALAVYGAARPRPVPIDIGFAH